MTPMVLYYRPVAQGTQCLSSLVALQRFWFQDAPDFAACLMTSAICSTKAKAASTMPGSCSHSSCIRSACLRAGGTGWPAGLGMPILAPNGNGVPCLAAAAGWGCRSSCSSSEGDA